MPYIKHFRRTLLRIVETDVSYIGTAKTQTEALNDLDMVLKLFPENEHDSLLNYLFTTLLLWCETPSEKVKDFIHAAISRYYLTDAEYFELERCIGLLCCMREEFKRRGWMSAAIDSWFEDYYTYVLSCLMLLEEVELEGNG